MTTQIEPAFSNPYDPEVAKAAGYTMTNVVCPVFTPEVDFFRLIRPAQGTITGIIGTMWRKLYNECNEREITDISKRNEFEQFLAGSKLISNAEYQEYVRLRGRGRLPNSPPSRPLPEPTASDERGAAPQSSHDGSANAPVIPDLQGGDRTQGTRKRKGQTTQGTGQGNVG